MVHLPPLPLPSVLPCWSQVGTLHELRSQALLELDEDFAAVRAAELATELCPEWFDGC